MSCFSRLLGLICALVPGLLFLAFSVRFIRSWPELGPIVGPFYSLLSFVTGAVCLYLGVSILFGRDNADSAAPVEAAPETAPALVALDATPEPAPLPMRAAPLPVEAAVAEAAPAEPVPTEVVTAEFVPATQSIFDKADDAEVAPPRPAPQVETPESRIRQLASTRPGWQVTAPQLAQLTNLNMALADATAREMVGRGEAQMQTGPNGEIIYIFDMAS